MRPPLPLFIIMLVPALASAQQQVPQGDGKLKDKLLLAIASLQAGDCPAKIMTPYVQYQCEQARAVYAPRLKAMGPPASASFMGLQQLGATTAEAYRVRFSTGEMLWMVNVDRGGRLDNLYSPG